MTDPFAHCLFPAFTQRLLRELGDGRSLNLVGGYDDGVERVLNDLARCLPKQARLLRVNLHDHRRSQAGMVEALWSQAKAQGMARNGRKAPASLADLADGLALPAGGAVWLALERLDTLLEDPARDPAYDCAFFNSRLNSLRNRPEIVLISHTRTLKKDEQRLILALDEYESLHALLRRDPEQAGLLLGAMRSFSQHQSRVILLFSGSALLSELNDPPWGRYFVQTVRLKLDYLSRDESLRLIREPVAPNLNYAPEVPEQLWQLTQGHPALLQLLCRRLVDIANRDGKAVLGMADLEETLDPQKGVIDSETLPIRVFWDEFCDPAVHPGHRETVRQILDGQTPDHRPSLARLKEHGFIVQENGAWRLRVPLFERWIREYSS